MITIIIHTTARQGEVCSFYQDSGGREKNQESMTILDYVQTEGQCKLYQRLYLKKVITIKLFMAAGKQLTIIFVFIHIYYYLKNKSIFIINSQIH